LLLSVTQIGLIFPIDWKNKPNMTKYMTMEEDTMTVGALLNHQNQVVVVVVVVFVFTKILLLSFERC